MQVKLSVRHGHLNEETQQVIRDKANKLLHYFERLTQIEVTVDLQQKEAKHVELVVQAEHKHDIVASETHAEVLTALDRALNRLEGRFRTTSQPDQINGML